MTGVPAIPSIIAQPGGKTSEVGRSYVAPPGVDAARGAALRKAFNAMVKDKDFLADMKKCRFEVSPATGEQIAKVAADVVNADAEVVERTRWATTPAEGAAGAKTR